MLLTVISSPVPVAREAETINRLFESGLRVFHLRKPGSTPAEVEKILNGVDEHFRSRIAIHDHHRYSDEWNIVRLHFPEKLRLETTAEKLEELRQEHYCSTSVHTLADLKSLPDLYDYVFAGPVFDSISKPGYKANPELAKINAHRDGLMLVAIGGINDRNISEVATMGFDGAALLGTIWNSSSPVTQFQKIRSWCEVNTGLNKEAFNF